LEASFSPQRSWASLFRAFLLPGDRESLSGPPSVLALPDKTITTLPRRFNGLLPPRKPCPFLLPKCLARVGTFCSLELSDLSGSPSTYCETESFFLPAFPSHPLKPPTLRYGAPRVSGPSPSHGLALSLYGRRPVWPFRSRTTCHPFKESARRGLFFPLKAPETSQPRSHFSLRPTALLLTGGGTSSRPPT